LEGEGLKKKHTPKRRGLGIGLVTVTNTAGDETYLVLKALDGNYHAFVEVEAKEAARACGGKGSNTRREWESALAARGIKL
jgi:hypothetical protein